MKYLPVLLWVALVVYCVIDAAQADEARVRVLRKPVWILLIVLFPFLGSLLWLLLGRPVAGVGPARPSSGTRRNRRPVAPDDDPDFLADLARANAQRERERRLREQHDDAPDQPPEDPSA
jgi:hypothetical protein